MSILGISTHSETPPIQRGGWLDALRFIVAFLIIIHHYELAAPVVLNTIHPVFERGYLLTNFFLIDSGYVLARVYAAKVLLGRMSPGDFYLKRFLRVIPAHVFLTTGLVGMVLLAGLFGVAPTNPEWFDWKELPAQATLTQAYIHGGKGWNAPTWSLSALLGCYLLFPLLIRPLSRLKGPAALGLAVVLYAVANQAAWTFLGYPVYQMPMWYGFLRGLPLFILGIALARVSETVFIPEKVARWAMAGAAVTLAVVQFYGRYSLISLSLIALIIICAGAIPVKRRSPMVEKAAIVSFSMFITNEIFRIGYFGVLEVLRGKLGWGEPVAWALWALAIPAAVAFAYAFQWIFDGPTQAWIGKRLDARKKRARAPAPVGGLAA